jgi:NAD(P)-dependent dehydrogenase (short-subunit alcohol dehydrogenase family)
MEKQPSQRPQLVSRASSATASKTVVLVTGGNAGIGFEIVKKLSTEYPSHQILMGSRDIHKAEDAVSSLGAPTNINPIQLDVTDDESINHCFKAIEQHFGRLDILINNAGTAGRDLPNRDNWRQVFNHCYNVNVTGAAILTETMLPLLEKSKLPKIIFISSGLGSITNVLRPEAKLIPVPFYSASKSAMNYLAAYYAKKCPSFKVNSCCPGFNATGLNNAELTEENHPRNGAINAVRLATEGPDGASGTYSNKEGPIPW